MSEAKNGRHVEENGEIRWYKNDILHRTDGPAIEYPDGSQAWFSNGVRHRSGEPAYVGADGSEEWWVRGVNIGKQIFIFQKFIFMLNLDSQKILKEYLVNGMRHNEDGHAVMYFNGTRAWYLNGILHRIDGPALLFQDGRGLWFKNGLPHREDGPAITPFDDRHEWYVEGVEYTKEEFDRWLENKTLNDNLHSTLEPKPTEKRLKI
ncbi:hypothetical protein [Burkholderia cepacia]|uniref:hypothetical protein n=1 Tax=Burkholderia cepacia TaxID=292 RepID=UPI001CF18989|nr:hypothetical protein [Burkholderia cepacia]MCA8354219.1 hypothetical protein [Burkholderia cepacia]